EGMNYGDRPEAQCRYAGCRWRLQVENRAARAGADTASRAIEGAVAAKGHTGIGATAVSFTVEDVQRIEEPAGAGVLELEDAAATLGVAVAIPDRAFRRGSIQVSSGVHDQSSVRASSVQAAGEIVKHCEGLRVSSWDNRKS